MRLPVEDLLRYGVGCDMKVYDIRTSRQHHHAHVATVDYLDGLDVDAEAAAGLFEHWLSNYYGNGAVNAKIPLSSETMLATPVSPTPCERRRKY